jgi:hypothetical protein
MMAPLKLSFRADASSFDFVRAVTRSAACWRHGIVGERFYRSLDELERLLLSVQQHRALDWLRHLVFRACLPRSRQGHCELSDRLSQPKEAVS